jgi:hypothetical protein
MRRFTVEPKGQDSREVGAGACKPRVERSAAVQAHVPALVLAGLLAMILAGLGRPLGAAEIDRLLAAVNGRVIAEGDLLLARNLNAVLSFGSDLEQSSESGEIDRLIDLELLRQELASFPMAPEDQSRIESRIQELRNAYAEIGGLPGLLRRLGLQESELLDYMRLQDSILHFVDFRFRPFVEVSEQEIQEYYKDKLVPTLQKAGAPVPLPAEVSARIQEVLKEEKVNASLTQWIRDVRRHSRIEYYIDGAEPAWGKKP